MIAALFSVLLFASDTEAAATLPGQAPAAAAEAPKDEKKICKREAATESRLGAKRVCLTAAQWRERQDGADVKGLGLISK